MTISKILVPIDFSDHSRPTADRAVNLANHFNAKVKFLHAIEPHPYIFASVEGGAATAAAMPSEREVKASLNRALDRFVAELPVNGRAETAVTQGDPAGCIEEEVEKGGFDLIVMPTRGYVPFRRLVLGSVTTKVINDVRCPVFTGAHIETVSPYDPHPYRRVGVAIDLKENYETVLRWAADFARSYNGELVVIHSTPDLDTVVLGSEVPSEMEERLVATAKETIRAKLDEMKIQAEIHVEPAVKPEQLVSKAVDTHHLDLVVIGRPHADGIVGKLTAHACAIVRSCSCPVVSV